MTLPPARRPPHPYARRHLAAHAAASGRLEDDVLNLETLPYLDEARLSALLRLTEPEPLSPQWLVLSAFRSIRHRWSWDDPDANAAALDVAHLAVDAMTPLPDRWTASGLAWKPRLAEWQSGGTIVAGDHRGGYQLAVGAVRGVPILVTGNQSWVRLWDPATGQPAGEPLYAPDPVHALALAEGPGLVLAACGGGRVIAWDALTHLPAATAEVSDPMPTALAVGDIEDRWVLAAGGMSGVVQVRWIDSGELFYEVAETMQVRAVALAKTEDNRLHLAIGYGDAGQGRIAVHDVLGRWPAKAGVPVYGEVNDVALAYVGAQFVVAAAMKDWAGIWDALSGAPVSPPVSHNGYAVSSVALTTIGWRHLLATGGDDRTARLWDALSGQPAEQPLPHPATVRSVAFGEVDGRTMLVTGCVDGHTRLWDPLRASGARVAVEGWFTSVAMDADIVVAGSEDGQVRLWHLASGASYPPLPAGGVYTPPSEPVVKVRLGGIQPRLLLAQYHDWIAIWDASVPRRPEFRQRIEIGTIRCVDVQIAGGRLLLSALDDNDEARITDLLTGMSLFATRIPGADSIRFIGTPSRPILGVQASRALHLLDAESGTPVSGPLPVSLPPHAAIGSLDGADVLAALDDDGLRIYDLRGGDLTIPPVEMSSTASGIAWGRVGERDVVVTAHFATVRVWNPRTGRKITELRFGTRIGGISVRQTDNGRLMVAVSGPGLVVIELRDISS